MSNILLTPFQLLELNVISAQDLAQVSRKMRTYAVAWVHPDRKLSTRVDVDGHTNPTWNDKFVFRVDDQFLHGDTSAIMIEIYAVHWLRDVHVGTVRVIVGNLIPLTRPIHHHRKLQLGMRFVALQVRRRSGRPQGILNIGVTLLDSSMQSLPLYSQLSTSAVGYLQLMGGGGGADPHHHNKDDGDKNSDNPSHFLHSQPSKPPQLRRTKSDSSSMMASSMVVAAARRKKINNKKASSEIDGSEVEKKSNNKKKGRSKASSTTSGSEIVKKGIKFEPGSLANGSDLIHGGLPDRSPYENLKNGTLKKMNYPTIPLISESDLGPSASEVAAAMAKNRRYNGRTAESEIEAMAGGGAWSLDMEGSIEGLQSKLDRWRAELPPVFDRSELTRYADDSEPPRGKKGAATAGGHIRRHSTGGNGSFSCFSVICGIECSIVCGGSPARENERRRVKRSRRRSAFE